MPVTSTQSPNNGIGQLKWVSVVSNKNCFQKTMEGLKFNDLKKKVGVDDIAFSLGYRLNRSAGIGKFIEMTLSDGRGGHTDTLVIRNPNSKADQTFSTAMARKAVM